MQLRNYSLEKHLGTGGAGTVFNGIDKEQGTEVAIKIVDFSSGKNREAFICENQVVEKDLQMKNIAEVYETFEEGNRGYIIMKKYDCDLFSYAFEQRDSLLPESVVQRLFHKICLGVKELHKVQIAHLDLKPENILLDVLNLEPYITDFGCAVSSTLPFTSNRKKRSRISNKKYLGSRGTRSYSCPEMYESPDEYDPFRADIFSLGVMLHTLVTGKYPEITDSGDISLEATKSHVSNDCFDLLSHLLHPDPSKRHYIDRILEHQYFNCKRNSKFNRISMALSSVNVFKKCV